MPASTNPDLKDARLYGIIDLGYVAAADCSHIAELMIAGGVDVIQLRGKKQSLDELVELATQLHKITSAAAIPLIANDHVEIAQRVPVEGVHVGQDDGTIVAVRSAVARPIIVGKSTHSRAQASAAQDEGADYIGFGPLFATPTKPDYQPLGLTDINQVHVEVRLPVFCIGGIKLDNLGQVLAAGAQRVVIVSGLLKAPDIAKYARACKTILNV